jgi:hypothetical protein
MRWALLCCLLLTGCVERRIYVISEPPGADVYVDGEFVGVTRPADHPDGPFYVNFIFYGTREYTLRLPGYATTSGDVELSLPWYQYFPVDFFAEVLAPWKIVNRHHVHVNLERAEPGNDEEELFRRAVEYRYASRPQDRYAFETIGGRRELPAD